MSRYCTAVWAALGHTDRQISRMHGPVSEERSLSCPPRCAWRSCSPLPHEWLRDLFSPPNLQRTCCFCVDPPENVRLTFIFLKMLHCGRTTSTTCMGESYGMESSLRWPRVRLHECVGGDIYIFLFVQAASLICRQRLGAVGCCYRQSGGKAPPTLVGSVQRKMRSKTFVT